VPPRRASAVVTTRGGLRWTLKAATDARGQRVRQRRVVLTPRCWRRRWQQYMAHRGERVISRKAIAQGMSDVLRFTCMLMRALLVHVAHETAGAARIRHSLRPLITGGRENNLQASGTMCREIAFRCHRPPPGRPNGRPMTGSG